MTTRAVCWCGSTELAAFSHEYGRCAACETLVSALMPGPEIGRVVDEERDFYGREYWFSHQEKELGLPSILERARTDLPERCLYWIRTLLKYKPPPARLLELGSGHGGFVALTTQAGYEATGLEVSPWVVKFAYDTFQVPILLGPVEDHQLEPASLDVIVLMDLLEHLGQPFETIRHCLTLLKPDGVLLIQTPCYVEGRSYEAMVARGERFLEELQPKEHLYLFSQRSFHELFRRLAVDHIVFEPPIFAEYDMFAVVSRAPLITHGVEQIEQALAATPGGRMVQALVDVDGQLERLTQRYSVAEADRVARLEVILEQGRRASELEARIGWLEAEPEARLREANAERDAQEQQIRTIMAQMRTLQQIVRAVRASQVYRLLRRMGRWGWIEDALARPPAPEE